VPLLLAVVDLLKVPTPPGSPRFFIENSKTWKIMENHFGPGKSWKKYP